MTKRKNVKQDVPTTDAPAVDVPATPVVVAQEAQVLYRVVATKRPLTGVKFGVSGNEFTHNKLAEAAAANGGVLTDQQARQVCVDAAHKGFYSYAVKRLKILVPASTFELKADGTPVVVASQE